MSFYTDMAALATEMLAEFGRDMILRSYTETGSKYNPTRVPSDSTVKGVVTGFSAKDIDGTLIQQGDKRIFIDAQTVPDNKMEIVDGSVTYQIINTGQVKPGDTDILYKLQVRA